MIQYRHNKQSVHKEENKRRSQNVTQQGNVIRLFHYADPKAENDGTEWKYCANFFPKYFAASDPKPVYEPGNGFVLIIIAFSCIVMIYTTL